VAAEGPGVLDRSGARIGRSRGRVAAPGLL